MYDKAAKRGLSIAKKTGLEMIDLGGDIETVGGCFFHPRSMNGILTEIIREGSQGRPDPRRRT